MRKFSVLTIAFVLLFCSFACAASFENPFETMSDQEIMVCYLMTMEQMNKRGLSPYSNDYGVMVPAGRYTVGVDIPAGVYRLEFPNDEYDTGSIMIYDSEGMLQNWYQVGKGSQVQVYGKLELTEGTIFELSDTTATFYTYTGLFGDFNE